MRCTQASEQLQLYLDHQLTLRQTRVLEAHVAGCPACRAELYALEEVASSLHTLKFVAEPADMHAMIMQMVALNAGHKQQQQHLKQMQVTPFSLFRPSLAEMLAASLLATVATLAILLQQPSLRVLLPITDGHDLFSRIVMQVVHTLMSFDANILILALWIVGTILGVCITLAVAGNEMRSQWFKAVVERLPVH
ncbi:MAG: anti-sigma factor family protein [Ktedonobacteraceae bacterium]